jgi:hypothetical protein
MGTLFVVTDTTGQWKYKEEPDFPGQPHMIRLAWIYEADGRDSTPRSEIIWPDPSWTFEDGAVRFHGIDRAFATDVGTLVGSVLAEFDNLYREANAVIMFGAQFQQSVLRRAHIDAGIPSPTPMLVIDAFQEIRKLVHVNAPRDFASCVQHCTGEPLRLSSDPVMAGALRVTGLREIWRKIVAMS